MANVKKLVPQDVAAAQASYNALVKLLAGVAGGATEAKSNFSTVKLGKARLEWLPLRDTAAGDIKKLKAAIASEFADDAEQAGPLAKALKKLDSLIAEVNNNLHEQLDAILNADAAGRAVLVAGAKATIARLTKVLDTDEVMVEIDDNEVVPGMAVVAPVRAKLQQISAALG